MDFNLGYIKSDKQFHIKTFSKDNTDPGKILELKELKQVPLNGLIYEQENLGEELNQVLSADSKFFPVRSNADLELSYDQFKALEFSSSQTIFNKINKQWLLQNNIVLIDELFPVLKHLKALWPNDRTTFFEELWSILKVNLAAKEVTLIFNDLKKSKKENEKDSLIHVKISGERVPNPTEGSELEEKLMKHYAEEFHSPFNLSEYNEVKGEVVLTATIEKSPVLVMAKVYQLTQLQKSLLKALFEGLSF